mmetsp:Transcript_32092/g.84032  ORF Transcript_32092/g.84032 Transcript_32092/m.84032 type:complete len:633 (+) Transcript_32092:3256-5154(+)
MRRLERQLHHLHVDLDRQLTVVRHLRHAGFTVVRAVVDGVRHAVRLRVSLAIPAALVRGPRRVLAIRLIRRAVPDGMAREAASAALAAHVRPSATLLVGAGQQRSGRRGDTEHSVHDGIELGLPSVLPQPADELAAEHVQALKELVLGDAPALPWLCRRELVVEPAVVPLPARGEEHHSADDRGDEGLAEVAGRGAAQHEQQVGVQVAHVARVDVEDGIGLGLVTLADELAVPREQDRAQIAPEYGAQLRLRLLEPSADARPELQAAVGRADRKALVRAAIELEAQRHVVVEARGEPARVQDDAGGRREERAGVEIARLLGELHDAARDGLGRAGELVEQQVVRSAEERWRRGGHVDGLEAGRRERQVVAGLEQHGIEERLQLVRLQRVDAVVGGEEAHHERDAQVGHGEVREQQLGVVLAECSRCVAPAAARRLGRKIGQLPHVQDVVLGVDKVRPRVLRRRREAREAVRRGHLALFDARPTHHGHVAEALDSDVRVLDRAARRLDGEGELRVALRPRVLGGEAPHVWIEKEFKVEGHVAVACKLGVVLDEQRVRVGHVAEQLVMASRKRHLGAHGAHVRRGGRIEPLGSLPLEDLGQALKGCKVVEGRRAREVELRLAGGHGGRLLGERR